jgi:hypothetical protein
MINWKLWVQSFLDNRFLIYKDVCFLFWDIKINFTIRINSNLKLEFVASNFKHDFYNQNYLFILLLHIYISKQKTFYKINLWHRKTKHTRSHFIYIILTIIYSLELASPTILSICLSSLNLSSTVPLTASFLPCTKPWVTPQHSITSGIIRLVFERQGLPNVEHENVCPWSKFAEINNPKWLSFPPKPMPFGMSSELKLTAHYEKHGHLAVTSENHENSLMNGLTIVSFHIFCVFLKRG